jgi:hypothetical protein
VSYESLRRLGATFRPIDTWPGEPTRGRTHSPFSAKLSQTLELLGRELRAVDARRVILQVALRDEDTRLDGFPKANRNATHPGVILAFESSHGPLKFAVDRFWNWEDNLRAIALGMEALRKVDRCGITRRGEQYTGWKALPSGAHDATYGMQSRADAERYLLTEFGDGADGPVDDALVKHALREAHPDTGGNAETFQRVMRAKELLGQ